MLLDMHCHTYPKSMCSRLLPVALLQRAVRRGLNGLVITEHHYLWPARDLESLRQKAGVPSSFVLLAAQEVETELGHVLVYGAGRTIAKKTTLKKLRSLFADACLIWAHPWRDGRIPSPEDIQNPLLDGIEIFNGNQTVVENYRALCAWHRYRFNAIGGSDVHGKKRVATFPTIFDHPVSDMHSLIYQLRNGNVRPLYAEHREQRPGSVLVTLRLGMRTVGRSTRCTVKQINGDRGLWQKALHTADLIERIRRGAFENGFYRIPQVIGRDEHGMAVFEERLKGESLQKLLPLVSNAVKKQLLQAAIDWLIHLHASALRLSSREDTRCREERFFEWYQNNITAVSYRYRAKCLDILAFLREYEMSALDDNAADYVQIHGNFTPGAVLFGYKTVFDQNPAYVAGLDCEQTVLWEPAGDIATFLAHLRFLFWKDSDGFSESDAIDLITRWAEGISMQHDKHLQRKIDVFTIRANFQILRRLMEKGQSGSSEYKWIIKKIFNTYKIVGTR